jgi:hypothetical protein
MISFTVYLIGSVCIYTAVVYCGNKKWPGEIHIDDSFWELLEQQEKGEK